MSHDKLNVGEVLRAEMNGNSHVSDEITIVGHYDLVCTDSQGNILWEDGFDNLVTTQGQVQLLVSGVAGSLPAYMGLMAGPSASTPAAADTLLSHSGWVEANGTNAPSYGATRPTITFGAAAAVSASGQISNNGSPATFIFTNGGTINGGFVAFGPGATSSTTGTAGLLLSAGNLGTPQPVISTNTITMTYTLTL